MILVRACEDGPRVLMGQRGTAAVFMPSKFVFPGGALDPEDAAFAARLPPGEETGRRLAIGADARHARGLVLTAIRELWEETGLLLGRRDPATAAGLLDGAPRAFRGILGRGVVPDPAGLRFVFRAITPPGRPRRFDARFFLAGTEALCGDPDDFSAAGDELGALQWIGLEAARGLALPFITEVVLSEVAAILRDGPRPVPFFHHDAAGSHISIL